MIYFIVTTCLDDSSNIRKIQYVNGIDRLKKLAAKLAIPDYKIIIVENNGERYTILNMSSCTVYYTNNNAMPVSNKGHKELQDIFDCIAHFGIDDDDFIVKMTGRYVLEYDSEFMREIQNLHNTNYDCVIKYGPYFKPVNYQTPNCITGLIGMRCKYMKQIEIPGDEPVEINWGKATYLIPDEKIRMVQNLGIKICPGCDTYFFV